MDHKEKLIARHKLALCLIQMIEDNRKTNNKNLVTSLRKLAASSGIEYAIIQRITSGKKDPQFTTLVAISEGLGVDIAEFLSGVKNITDQAALKHVSDMEKKNKKKPRK